MFCSKCGIEIPNDSEYCWKCGYKISVSYGEGSCLSRKERFGDSECGSAIQSSNSGSNHYLNSKKDDEASKNIFHSNDGSYPQVNNKPMLQTEMPSFSGSRSSDCNTISIKDATVFSESEISSEIDNFPAIKNWESAPGYSFFGFVSGIFACLALFFICVVFGTDIYVSIILITLARFIYCLSFYPSYFSDEPLLKNSKAISFWNYAICDPIFGYFLNNNLRVSNLEKRLRRGIASKVAIALSLVNCMFAVSMMLLTPAALARYDYSNADIFNMPAISKTTNEKLSSYQINNSSEYHDESTGVSFVIPEGWHEEPLTNDDYAYLQWKATRDNHISANLFYSFGDLRLVNILGTASITNLSGEDIKEMLEVCRSVDPDASIEMVNIGDCSYLKTSMTFMYRESYPVHNVTFTTLYNGREFSFSLVKGCEIDGEEYAALEELVQSVRFE